MQNQDPAANPPVDSAGSQNREDGSLTTADGGTAVDGVAAVDNVPVAQEELLDSVVWDLMPDSLQSLLELLSFYPLLLIAIVVGLGFLLGKLLQKVLDQIIHRVADKTQSDFDDQLFRIMRRPALTIPLVVSLALTTVVLGLPASIHSMTVSVLATIMLFSLLRAALKACHVFLEMLAARKDKLEIIQARTIPMFEISIKLILVAIAGYLLLAIWGINPTAWLASAGVIGIAVGFAARDSLANLFSGIFIAADSPYKIGDYIVLDTGERGEVTHLGMRSTRLLTRDDVEVTIPNAIIANAKIINESGGPWEKHRIRIPVGVAYGSDIDQVQECLMAVARDNDDMLDYPAPRVRMRRFGSYSVDFELLGWIDKPSKRGLVMHELLAELYKRFGEQGITIPFPQQDIYLRPVNQQQANSTEESDRA